MASHVLEYVRLPKDDLKQIGPELGEGDRVEVRLHRKSGDVELPEKAIELVQVLVEHLLRGESVAVLAEEMELSPTQAAGILGISRPLVVHRMNIGDLPFRYVGTHRRTTMKDVLLLKSKLDDQQKALRDLAEDTENLMRDYEL